MDRVSLLKKMSDFYNTRINPKDRILIKYKTGKLFLLYVEKVDGSDLVCKSDPNSIQETFVNINTLINRDLGKYVEYVILERHSIKKIYTTQLDLMIRKLEEVKTNLVKAYNSNYFCDNETTLRDINAITKSVPIMLHDILLHEINYTNKRNRIKENSVYGCNGATPEYKIGDQVIISDMKDVMDDDKNKYINKTGHIIKICTKNYPWIYKVEFIDSRLRSDWFSYDEISI